MDLMRKIINSPLVRRRSQHSEQQQSSNHIEDLESMKTSDFTKTQLSSTNRRYFGVPLDEIVERDGTDVPLLIVKASECICRRGLDQEGIFRISGNLRSIDRLKVTFDSSGGDVDLSDEEDIMAVAGLLKLFLRELPDSLIPQTVVKQFNSLQDTLAGDKDLYHKEMRLLLRRLAKPNFETLKYLISLLVLVSKNESVNKMNPLSLGIVFGPNIFRSASSMEVFREQSHANFIVIKFITDYDELFLEPDEVSSSSDNFSLKPIHRLRSPPPRPPLPKDEDLVNNRKQPVKRSSSNVSNDDLKLALSTSPWSDEEIDDAHQRVPSPYHLDSDRSEIVSARITPSTRVNTDVIDKAIRSVVTERMFGDASSDELSSSNDKVPTHAPVPLPRRRRHDKLEKGIASNDDDDWKGIEKNLSNGHDSKTDIGNDRKSLSVVSSQYASSGKNSANDSDEDLVRRRPVSHQPSSAYDETDGAFGDVIPASSTLSRFDRPTGPKNRRPPSWSSFPHDKLPPTDESRTPDDMISTQLQSSKQLSTASANVQHRPSSPLTLFIPPLDLTTLHQHGDGHDPIPSNKSSLLKVADNNSYVDGLFTNEKAGAEPVPAKRSHISREGLVSPSATRVTPYLSAQANIDMPPSPNTHQLYIKSKYDDEELRNQKKVLTKKIQSCKKKLKIFEEQFEAENGRRPSQADKNADPEIRNCVKELANARRELHKLKEDLETTSSMINSANSGSGDAAKQQPDRVVNHHLEIQCRQLCDELNQNRKEAGRSDDLQVMTAEQLRDEKTAVQKMLLRFEGLNGRPVTKAEKELMRPLYNRYRQIKQQLVSKPSALPNRMMPDLPSVPEGYTLDFMPTPETAPGRREASSREPVRIPSAGVMSPQDDSLEDPAFMVTRLMPTTLDKTGQQAHRSLPPGPGSVAFSGNVGAVRQNTSEEKMFGIDSSFLDQITASRLHQLSLNELQEEKNHAVAEKRRLARLLRQFEESFQTQNGRKVQKEDRGPYHEEYKQYKQVKARLRLLDALAAKQNAIGGTP